MDRLRFNGEGQAPFGAHFQTERDGFLNVLDGLRLGLALTHTARNGRTFGDPHPILVAVNRNGHFQVRWLAGNGVFCKRLSRCQW